MLFSSLVQPVSTITVTCPTPAIIDAIRQTVIDICNRGQVWKYEHPDITLVAGTHGYTFSPPTNTVISMVESARINDAPIEITTPQRAIALHPEYPDDVNTGPVQMMFQLDQDNFVVVPTPDDAVTYTLQLITTLRPTLTSVSADDILMREHYDTIVHGAAHKLLLQQKTDWFNPDLAGYHGKMYSYKLNNGKAVANRGFNTSSISAVQRPFA